MSAADPYFERVARLGLALPKVERTTSYRTDALSVAGKSFVRMKEGMDGVLVVHLPLDLKEALIDAEPDKYFETPHYAGYPAMLVRLDAVSDEELQTRLDCSWAQKAPAKLRKEHYR